MRNDFARNLEKYADVIVKVGLNLQPGQRLLVGAPTQGMDGTPLEAYPLVRHIVRAAYQAGARYVAVNWDDEALQRIRVQHAAADTMDEFAAWKNDIAVAYVDNGDAFLSVRGQDPDLFGGLDPEKVRRKQQTEVKARQELSAKTAAPESNWLIVGAAVTSWARKVFPQLESSDAVRRLWDAIFAVCRLDEADPVAAWERHIVELAKRADYLNGKQYTALTYTAPGTELTVGLPAGHIWRSGRLAAQNGIEFVANLPTEEVFTLPHKDRVDGVVTATMPLSYGGSLIDGFTLTFAEGRVVSATAASGQAALDSLLDNDETSRALGEVALVPQSSPISQTGLLFFNTLYDENASNHLAVGNAYRFSMQGGEAMTDAEFIAAGGNKSMTHVDFMIGSRQMDVDGVTADGATEAVMRAGDWAFPV